MEIVGTLVYALKSEKDKSNYGTAQYLWEYRTGKYFHPKN